MFPMDLGRAFVSLSRVFAPAVCASRNSPQISASEYVIEIKLNKRGASHDLQRCFSNIALYIVSEVNSGQISDLNYPHIQVQVTLLIQVFRSLRPLQPLNGLGGQI